MATSQVGEQTRFALPHQPEYDHTQEGPLYLLILFPAIFTLLLPLLVPDERGILAVSLLSSLALAGIAFSFRTLRVVDEGDLLAIRYGPLPVLRKRFRYADILRAERDRSRLIDGWGIHWVPGRGTTYNLWGFDCVRLTLANGRTVRIGTDDPVGLAEFLRQRLHARAAAPPS